MVQNPAPFPNPKSRNAFESHSSIPYGRRSVMRVTHSATRSLIAGALVLGLAACGKDNGPSEFSPTGTSADMAAAEGAFRGEQATSFAVLGPAMSAVLGSSGLAVQTGELVVHGATGKAARYGQLLTALVPRRAASPVSAATLPSEVLGTTFVWDTTSDSYVASDQAGAPPSGVRFQLYAVDPVLLQPVEPLVEVGYVDLVDHGTASTVDLSIKVVEGGVVYLQYQVTATPTANGGVIGISGFATNGTTLANFDLQNSITGIDTSPVITFNYHVGVPSRHVSVDWSATQSNLSDTEVGITLTLSITGPNGQVRITGSYTVSGGSFQVKVNGELFATVSIDPETGTPVITGAGGGPLTADEEATLQTILGFYQESADVFAGLLSPLV
jgi:hypothetical protein